MKTLTKELCTQELALGAAQLFCNLDDRVAKPVGLWVAKVNHRPKSQLQAHYIKQPMKVGSPTRIGQVAALEVYRVFSVEDVASANQDGAPIEYEMIGRYFRAYLDCQGFDHQPTVVCGPERIVSRYAGHDGQKLNKFSQNLNWVPLVMAVLENLEDSKLPATETENFMYYYRKTSFLLRHVISGNPELSPIFANLTIKFYQNALEPQFYFAHLNSMAGERSQIDGLSDSYGIIVTNSEKYKFENRRFIWENVRLQLNGRNTK